MKAFDQNIILLSGMYQDPYFPDFLVDKVRTALEKLIAYLEPQTHSLHEIQNCLDAITDAINDLQGDFEENNSEIETAARDDIAVSVEKILDFYGIDIDLETALRNRDW